VSAHSGEVAGRRAVGTSERDKAVDGRRGSSSDGVNVVVVSGVLSRPASVRVLPSGDRIANYEVTVHRAEGRTETVPVAWPDPPASATDHDIGEAVLVVGRVRRRFFRAGGTTQSRTEVVADAVVRAGRASASRRALASAHSRLAEVLC